LGVSLKIPHPRTSQVEMNSYVIYRFVVILQHKAGRPTSKQMMNQRHKRSTRKKGSTPRDQDSTVSRSSRNPLPCGISVSLLQ
jgi:hypothetical protein